MDRQTTARLAGFLYITATAAGVLSATLLSPLGTIASRRHEATAGALLTLIMTIAIALIPPTLFPALKRHGEALALSYVVARTLEVVLLLPAAVGPLMLLALPDNATHLAAVQTYELWGHPSSAVFFCLSVLLLNYLLYRSRLVPRWISSWALIAVAPYLAGNLLVMFNQLTPSSPAHTILFLPLALNEMVLAIWLLTKGLRVRLPAQADIATNTRAI